MLVLSAKPNEPIMIDNHIKITVLGVQGQQVRMGFEAPKEVEIHREKIFKKIQQQKNKSG